MVVATQSPFQFDQSIACGPKNCLVAFGQSDETLKLTTMSTLGVVLSRHSLAAPGYAASSQVVWNGTNYLVTWSSYDSSGTQSPISAARVSEDGETITPLGVLVASSLLSPLALAWNGTRYALFWADSGGIKAMEL